MSGTTPQLSVIVPTHNVRPWISETLRSVLVQDVESMEVIVVDDHSDDGTPELVESIARVDDRVSFVRATRQGGGSARNEGVLRARGRFLVFADGDDIVPAGAYRALVSSLQETGSDIAVGDYLKFSPNRTWRPTASMRAFDTPVQRATLVDIPSLIFSRPCWNKAFDRRFWQTHDIRFPDVRRSNDIVPMVSAYVNAKSIDLIEDVVYLYRDRPGGTSMTSKASSIESLLSYLGQEKICATLVSAVGDDALSSHYAALIHDRDGFFHIRKFLLSWTQPQEQDDAVVRELAELLSLVAPPASWVDVRKRLAMRLVVSGHILAARAAAQTVDEGEWRADEGLIRLQAVRSLLEQMSVVSELGVIEEEMISGVAQALAVVPVVDDEIEKAWVDLALAGVDRFGDRLRSLVPELSGRAIAVAAARQRLAAGTVTPLFGRDPLRIHARVSSKAGTPVLWSTRLTIEPQVLSWRDVADGGAIAEATFPVRRLPRGVLLRPAFRFEDGVVVSAHADSRVPDYNPFDNVLYEQTGTQVALQRRAHWLVRAPRRLALTVRAKARRLLPRRGASA